MKTTVLILGLTLLTTACARFDNSYMNFIDGLNKREVKGCYENEVTFAGGTGIGGSIHMKGIILTGGMTAEDCASLQRL